ncbi:MAG TPA: acetyl-CoA carboxylase biotin carboxyl carrier protein [Candidatus Binatia bacterium]|nr:acetyl-CoA carboxylase biotin carboxyl carrier protein [Candidatus Binatia bacterium]
MTALARELGAVMRELDLAEIEAALGEVRIRLQRSLPVTVPPAAAPAPPAVTAAATVPLPPTAGPTLTTVEAPMVGTFYRAPSPGAEPYVREGDLVKPGQVLGIIEAMKLMNEIEARVGGRVVKILVENAQPVEYGQPLFLIDPAG